MSDETGLRLAMFREGKQWCTWRPWPWRRRIATFLRGGGWHDGEWVTR